MQLNGEPVNQAMTGNHLLVRSSDTSMKGSLHPVWVMKSESLTLTRARAHTHTCTFIQKNQVMARAKRLKVTGVTSVTRPISIQLRNPGAVTHNKY